MGTSKQHYNSSRRNRTRR